MVDIEQTLLDIVGHTYETAHDDEQWKLVTEGICRLLDASGARLLLVDKTHRHSPLILGGGNIEQYRSFIERRDEDPWLNMAANLAPGDVRMGRELVSENELLQTDFYYDILKPADYRYAMGCVVDDTDNYNVGLSLNRGPKQSDFSERDRLLISKLAPHLKRAILLRSQVQTIQQHSNLLENSLNSLTSALAIVDSTGKICFINLPMELMLQSQTAIDIREKKLVIRSTALQKQLDHLIASAAATFQGNEPTGLCSFLFPTDKTNYNVLVLPLGSSAFHDLTKSDACVAISISEQTGGHKISRKLLSGLYQLTTREAQLCEELLADCSLNEAASKIGITPSTARSYLKSIFQKVDVQSQSSLILRLSKLSGLK